MTCTKVTILSPHDLVEKAMQAMTETKRSHVLIRENGNFVAILSIGDLLYYLLEESTRVIAHLEHYITYLKGDVIVGFVNIFIV